MNEQRLSKRLAKVARFVPEQAILADIGSDHAYLPAWLILNHKIKRAIAGEVVEGPYQTAKKLVERLGLQEKIVVRKGDGLEVIESADQVNCVTICGMGGLLISEILERGDQQQKLASVEYLILQPNMGERLVRKWLQEHQYAIIAESILEEDQKIYEIIVAKKMNERVKYSEKELLFGPISLKEKNLVFCRKWQHELKQKKTILKQLTQAKQGVEKKALLQEQIQLLEEVLQECQS